jgi:hypothetical protein
MVVYMAMLILMENSMINSMTNGTSKIAKQIQMIVLIVPKMMRYGFLLKDLIGSISERIPIKGFKAKGMISILLYEVTLAGLRW